MSWVRLDDGFPDHPKVLRAGPEAAWLYVTGLCYAQRQLTDGLLRVEIVRRLADVRTPLRLAEKLVEVGLWDRTEDGFQIHDFLELNESSDVVKAKKKANNERVAAWREKREGNAVRNALQDEDVTHSVRSTRGRAPIPSPPIPELKAKTPLSPLASRGEAGERFGGRKKRPEKSRLSEFVETTGGGEGYFAMAEAFEKRRGVACPRCQQPGGKITAKSGATFEVRVCSRCEQRERDKANALTPLGAFPLSPPGIPTAGTYMLTEGETIEPPGQRSEFAGQAHGGAQ